MVKRMIPYLGTLHWTGHPYIPAILRRTEGYQTRALTHNHVVLFAPSAAM
jgi:hypothetical protein